MQCLSSFFVYQRHLPLTRCCTTGGLSLNSDSSSRLKWLRWDLRKRKKISDSFDIAGYFVIYKAIVRENLFKNCKLTTITSNMSE